MKREAASQKIMVLGVDGMDPRLTCKYMAEGKMPNVKKLMERGACRDDLVLLGANPTVTPANVDHTGYRGLSDDPRDHRVLQTFSRRAGRDGVQSGQQKLPGRTAVECVWPKRAKKRWYGTGQASTWPPSSDVKICMWWTVPAQAV